jgi:4-amino-4-deoxy-L-arabinose transferase-like glycosyltransferase
VSRETEKVNYKRAAWFIAGLWFLLCLTTLNYNGPFFDEGIYITSGVRTLEGHGLSDLYLTWFGGSLLWPILAGIGYRIGGLIGARVVALLVTTGGFIAFMQAAKNLFGWRAGFWATLAFALNGPLFSLARLAVYDGLAWAGIAVAFWAITELERRDNRVWLAVAATAFTVATFAKYPVGVMIVPLVGILLVTRKDKAIMDAGILGFISAGIGLMAFLPLREQLAQFFSWRLSNTPSFGVTIQMIGFAIVYLSAAPTLLAAAGWFVAKGKRLLTSIFLACLTIWPAYHLLRADPTSTNKHLVFGFLFAYPLVGVALSALWGEAKNRYRFLRWGAVGVIVLALAGIGIVQVNQADQGWPNARNAAGYLVNNVQPGDQLLINESWPYTMYLYTSGRIESPWDVYDDYRITHGESKIDLCEYDWFVNSKGSYSWSEDILKTVEECGNFELTYKTVDTAVNLAPDLRYVSYQVYIEVWHNTSER